MKKLTTKELANVGVVVDPTNPQNGIRFEELTERLPGEDWGLDLLEAYADYHHSQLIELGRRTAVHTFRLGKALLLIRPRLKNERTWCLWQKSHNIARNTAWEAIGVGTHFKSESELGGMGVTEAKQQAGVIRQRPKSATSAAIEQPHRRSKRNRGDGVEWRNGIGPRTASHAVAADVDNQNDDDDDYQEALLVRLERVAEVVKDIRDEAGGTDWTIVGEVERQQHLTLLDEITECIQAIRLELEQP